MDEVKEILGRQVGPYTVGVWILVIAGGLTVAFFVRGAMKPKPQTGDKDYTDDPVGTDLPRAVIPVTDVEYREEVITVPHFTVQTVEYPVNIPGGVGTVEGNTNNPPIDIDGYNGIDEGFDAITLPGPIDAGRQYDSADFVQEDY